MSVRSRTIVFAVACAGFLALLIFGVLGMQPFGASHGSYEKRREIELYHARHVTNIDTLTNFDYRGIDTVGEEFIMFAAIAGLSLLLREHRGDRVRSLPASAPGREAFDLGEPVRWIAAPITALVVTFGYYVVLHGQLTPGGGFQGGAIIASALAMIYLAFGHDPYRRLADHRHTEPLEATGAAGYVLVGLVGLSAGATFLQNVIPLGKTGNLFSGGTIFAINMIVGMEVVFAFVVMFEEFFADRAPEKKSGS